MNDAHQQAQQEVRCRDALTGLNNRRKFDFRMIGEFNRGGRYGRVFSMLRFDIDYFDAESRR